MSAWSPLGWQVNDASRMGRRREPQPMRRPRRYYRPQPPPRVKLPSESASAARPFIVQFNSGAPAKEAANNREPVVVGLARPRHRVR